MNKLLAAVLFSSMAIPALAVYRCEVEGKVAYSDQACASGKAIVVPTTSPASLSDANRVAANERAVAERMASQRAKSEAQEQRQMERAHRVAAKKKKKCMLLAQRQKWAEEDSAKASGKAVMKSRTKAKRAAERYSLECGPMS